MGNNIRINIDLQSTDDGNIICHFNDWLYICENSQQSIRALIKELVAKHWFNEKFNVDENNDEPLDMGKTRPILQVVV